MTPTSAAGGSPHHKRAQLIPPRLHMILGRLLRIVFQHNRNVHFAWLVYADTHVVSRPVTVFEPKIAISRSDIDVETDGVSSRPPVGDVLDSQIHRRRRIARWRAAYRSQTAARDFPITCPDPTIREFVAEVGIATRPVEDACVLHFHRDGIRAAVIHNGWPVIRCAPVDLQGVPPI